MDDRSRITVLEPPSAGPARSRAGPGVAVGIDEAMIERMVHAFYARVREDPTLGPIFNGKVADWDAHLTKLCDFWSSVMLMTGRFKGAPMIVHAQLPDIGSFHFRHWLSIWDATADETCPPAAAALFKARAHTVARSLEMGRDIARAGSGFG